MRDRIFIGLVAIAVTSAAWAEPKPEPIRNGRALAINSPAPKLPREVIERHLAGRGVCVVSVRPDGTVSKAEMLQSTGHAVLDQVTIEAFSRWRFKPGTISKVKIPINYTGNYTKPPKA